MLEGCPERNHRGKEHAEGNEDGGTHRRQEELQEDWRVAQHEREVQEESTEQHEHHSTHHDEAEPSVSGCLLAKSTCLATHTHEQESSDERMEESPDN